MRVEEAEYADAMGEAAVATSTGVRATGRESGCYVVVSTLATEGDETQTGFGFSVGRDARRARHRRRPRGEGAERATRLLGATKPAVEARSRSCSTRTSRRSSCRSCRRRSTASRC